MPLRTESLEEPQLNLTSMIDVVFLLIIFFMVGTRFTEIEQKLDIELPTATPMEAMSRQPDPLIVDVSRTGEISVNGALLTRDELKSQLVAAREVYPEQVVVIRGDGDATYQRMFDVMDTCRQAEIRHYSLAFQPNQDEQGRSPVP
ncbi:MAG: biopolymer transporter ExbD [Planctomycetaceae bacterium]|nr:biopolymer transporter ExbD [Planctomycetaceae bacterium]